MIPIAWHRMTSTQVFTALRTAPRVAGPWDSTGARRDPRGLAIAWGATEEARGEADARLRADGFLLVDREGM